MTDSLTFTPYVDGEWIPTDGPMLDVINPATEGVIGTVPEGTVSDVVRAIDAARRAFDEGPWPRMSVQERSRVLIRFAEAMERAQPELVDLNIAEAGSARLMAESIQVGIPIAHFRDMAERVMSTFAWEEPLAPFVGQGIGQGVISREPFGVTALIAAYNYPFFLAIMKLAPALAAGCTVVLKPAPTTPLEAFMLGKFADEAGLPPGVLNVVTGDVAASQELTTNPKVDLVSFTGSDTVGRLVYAQAAPTMKKVILELGGKSANVISDDADLDRVVPDILFNTIAQAGQGCALMTRTLVHRSRHDELIEKLTGAFSYVKVGDPSDPTVMMGPLISAAQRTKVEGLIATGVDEGAKIVFGGGRPAGLDKGFFVEPTLFTGVENSMTIAQTEFFGPAGVVIPFDSDDDAVKIANDSDYGLGGGVWAKDPTRAYGIAKQIRTGLVIVNGGGGGLSPYAAFGGYKQSGLGREWGAHGLSEFLQTKTITWGVAGG